MSCHTLKKPHSATLEPGSRAPLQFVTSVRFGAARQPPAKCNPALSVCDDVCPSSVCFRTAGPCFHNYMFITPLNPTRTDIMPCPPTCQPIHLEESTLVPQLTSFDAVLLNNSNICSVDLNCIIVSLKVSSTQPYISALQLSIHTLSPVHKRQSLSR